MISFKAFVKAIHEAIMSASNTLMDKNVDLLDKYFEETTSEESDKTTRSTLVPKNVILEYPVLNSDGKVEQTKIQVPLITLVPLSMSQIEKATLTAEFEMEIIDGELQLSFPNKKSDGVFNKKTKSNTGKLEITISPQESSEGLKLIVEGYEAVLRQQLS